MNFKVGDVVERIGGSNHVVGETTLVTGGVYTVAVVDDDGTSLTLIGFDSSRKFMSIFFKLVTEDTSCIKTNKEKHMSITIIKTVNITGKGKDVTKVDGLDVADLSDDDILSIITCQEERIAMLDATKAKPKRLKDNILTLKAELKTFIELID